MTSHIASMLDELMGRNRNLLPDEAKARQLKWNDPDVCRYYIVDFCPHDLFTNTKVDLGPCGKIHDDELKKKYQEEKDPYKKAQLMDDFLRFCQRMLSDLQNRIKRAKERLLLTQQNEERMLNAGGTGVSGGLNAEADEQIVLLSEKIAALVAEAEEAGTQGNVEQAQGLMKLCDQLREERDNLRRSVLPSKEEYNVQQKAMEVCETCGAFLIVGDAQQRIDDHLLGKQHMGYAKLRATVDKVLDERTKMREERNKEFEEKRKKREEERKSRDSEERKKRDRSRDRRHRSRSREDKRRRSRSRERRRRSRDRRSHSRNRSRDRKSRDRSRNRSRERSRDRKSRDRSRNRSSERSRDRRRNRSRSRSRKRSRSPRRSDRREKRRSKSRERRSRRSRSRSRGSDNGSRVSEKKESENNHVDNNDDEKETKEDQENVN